MVRMFSFGEAVDPKVKVSGPKKYERMWFQHPATARGKVISTLRPQTASVLGTDTDGSGGNQYEPASAASGTSPLATSAANGSRSGSLGKVPQAAGAGRTGFGENPVARWPRPEPRASSEPAYACGKCKLHGSMHKP